MSIFSTLRTLRLNPPRPAPAQSSFDYDLSVENSFGDTLVVQASRQQMYQAELAVFKMLETTADEKNEDSLTSYRDEVSLVSHEDMVSLSGTTRLR